MILYIHGFGSSGEGRKAKIFREHFRKRGVPFMAPSLSYIPELAIKTLEEIIEMCEDITLIGSSLGGYYAIYLAEKYGLKAVLINPAVRSSKTLKRAIDKTGLALNYYDSSHFEWRKSYLDMLEVLHCDTIERGEYYLMLQTGDEVLDYQEAVNKLPHAKTMIEEGGTHSFEGIERYYTEIENFLRR